MSLIIAIPTKEGIVLGSDLTMRVGQIEQQVPKIHKLTENICMAATGEYALVQRVQEALGALQNSTQSLRDLMVPISNIIKACMREILAADFRTEIYLSNINAISQLHRADFVFAQHQPQSLILHLSSSGTPLWQTDSPFLVGVGDAFAAALLKKYLGLHLDLRLGSLLTARLLEETIDAGIYGLKLPIDIWQISEQISRCSPEEINKLLKSIEAVRQHELAVFEKHLTVTVSH